MRKTLSLLCALFLGSLLVSFMQSCEPEEDPTLLHLSTLDAVYKRITAINVNNQGVAYYHYLDYAADSAGIRYDSLGIQIKHNWVNEDNTPFYSLNQFGFTTANADVDGYSYDRILDILIVSNQDYDAQHPAGSNLKDLFTVRDMATDTSASVSAYPSFQSLFSYAFVENEILFLVPKAAPQNNNKHTINITYVLENGKTVKTTLPEVFIKVN